MQRYQMTSWAALALAVGAMTMSASAFPVSGDPAQDESLGGVEGGWSKSWVHFRFEKFDHFAVRILSPGDAHAADAVSRLWGKWTVVYSADDLVVFERATPGRWLGMTLHYDDTFGTPGDEGSGWDIGTSWATFLGDDLIESIDVNHGEYASGPFNWGHGWRGGTPGMWSPNSWAEVESVMLPLPAPVAMGAVGLIAVFLGRNRIRRLVG